MWEAIPALVPVIRNHTLLHTHGLLRPWAHHQQYRLHIIPRIFLRSLRPMGMWLMLHHLTHYLRHHLSLALVTMSGRSIIIQPRLPLCPNPSPLLPASLCTLAVPHG